MTNPRRNAKKVLMPADAASASSDSLAECDPDLKAHKFPVFTVSGANRYRFQPDPRQSRAKIARI